MITSLFESAVGEVVEFIQNPVSKTVKTMTQPARDGLDVIDGLSVGEIRAKAALRLGADVVGGMALAEVIAYLVEHIGE